MLYNSILSTSKALTRKGHKSLIKQHISIEIKIGKRNADYICRIVPTFIDLYPVEQYSVGSSLLALLFL